MWHRLFRLLALLLLWVACAGPALAQPPPQSQPQKPNEEEAKEVDVSNAPPYAAAILSTFLVLLIVCKPSRKA